MDILGDIQKDLQEARVNRLVEEANTLRSRLREHESTIKILRDNNTKFKTARDNYKQQVELQKAVDTTITNDTTETKIKNLQTVITNGKAANEELRQTIDTLTAENKDLKVKADTLTEENKKIAKELYNRKLELRRKTAKYTGKPWAASQ